MIVIRSAEALTRLLATHPDPELKTLLQARAARLAEYEGYDLSELAMFAIVQPGDDLLSINAAIGWSLLDGGTFSKPIELIARHEGWFEAITILDDTGFGLVLFVPIDERTDKMLIAACETALTEQQKSASS